MKCFAPFCSNIACAEFESRGITFHKFPTGRSEYKAWLKALGRQNCKVPQGALVCSQHFLAEDFCDTRRCSKKLRPGVVPFVINDDEGALDAKYVGADMNGHGEVNDLKPVPDKVNIKLEKGNCLLAEDCVVEFKQEFTDKCTVYNEDVLHTKDLMEQEKSRHEISRKNLVSSAIKYDLYSKKKSNLLKSNKRNFKPPNCINLESLNKHKDIELKTLVVALTRCDEASEYRKLSRIQNAGGMTQQKMNKQFKKNHSKSLGSKKSLNKDTTKKKNTRIQKTFICDYCNHISKSKQSSDLHLRTHTGETPFACDYCEYKCINKLSLNIHVTKHTGKKIACHICARKFAHKSYLASHIKIHASEQPFWCDLCEYKCNSKTSLKIHMAKHTGVYNFACHICEKKFATKNRVESHIRTHTGEQPFSCDQCSFKTSSSSVLCVHKKIHTGERKHLCNVCKYKFRTAYALTRHMRTHTGEKPFSCAHCDFKSARKCTLIEHLRKHTGEKPHICKVCPSKFSTSSGLHLHKRIHSGERNFQCKVCHSYFKRRSYLKLHMICHTGNRLYPCEYCDYKTKTYLYKHMEMHTREKQFHCNDCDYKCWTTESFIVHTRTHTGEKPYACKQCEFRTTSNCGLRSHMRTHTG